MCFLGFECRKSFVLQSFFVKTTDIFKKSVPYIVQGLLKVL